MVFGNIGAILGGAAEQIVDMQEDKIQRVNLLTDKYWDQHTQNMFDKKAKEDAKAELVENSIQKLSSFYDGNIDAGAALYNKLGGNIETADEFYKAALYQRDTLGEDIKPMLGSIDENFEASGMSAADYAESFRKPVSLDITIPEGTDSKVAKELQKRQTEMQEAGLLPKGIKTDKPTFAELKGFDRSKFNTSTNIEVIKDNLIIKVNNLDPNSETYEQDKANFESRIARINSLQQKAEEGVYDDPLKINQARNTIMDVINDEIRSENNVEKTGTTFVEVDGQMIKKTVNATTARAYRNSILPRVLEQLSGKADPRTKDYYLQAAKILGYEEEAENLAGESVEESASQIANNQSEDKTVEAPKKTVAKGFELDKLKDSFFELPLDEAAQAMIDNTPADKPVPTLDQAKQLITEEKNRRKSKIIGINVTPRPDGNRNPNLVKDMMEWDKKYGDTHNPDGSPKEKQT